MSYNQSRAEKNESNQYRKQQGRSSNSSNNQRSSSSAKGGGGTGPAPSLSSNRSFKKSSNVQGGHPKLSQPAAAPPHSAVPSIAGSAHNAPSVAYSHLPIHGASDTPVISGIPKHHEPSVQQRSTPVVPKAPTSQHASMSPDSSQSATPVKVAGDASKGAFPFQFGSLSPGLMNGMQIPARTSSAPPNLDEQKQDLARHDTSRSVPPVPTPIPKQQPHKRDVISVDKAITGDSHPIPKLRKETQGPPPVSQTQKPPVLPFSVTSMPMSFHQAQPAVQFGSPNPQIQPRGVTATSLQMPVPVGLPLGNAPQAQQPMFVQGLQPHPIQPQGIMHQGQSLSFTTQMGPQHPPQLSNMGIGISLQYPQQPGGKYGGQRKTTVKITDPNTHEELRLADGGSSGMRSHPNVPQSQQIHSFPPHAISYYPTSYGGSNIFFPPQGSMPLTTGQIASNPHAPRYNYTVNPGAQSLSYMDPSVINSLPFNKSITMIHGVGDQPNFEHNREVRNPVSVSSSAVQVTVKPAAASTIDKAVKPPSLNNPSIIEPGVAQKHSRSSDKDGLSQPPVVPKQEAGGESVASESLPAVVEQSLPRVVESSICDSLSSLSLTTEESVPTAANVEGRRKEPLVRSNSIKDHQKKMGQKEYSQPQNQAVVEPTTMSSLPSCGLDHGKLLDGRSADALEAKATFLPPSVSEGMAEFSAVEVCTTDVSGSKADETCDSSSHAPSEPSVAKVITNTHESTYQPELDTTSLEKIEDATSRTHMVEPNKLVEDFKQEQDLNSVSGPDSLRSEEPVELVGEESTSAAALPTNEVLVNTQLEHVDPVHCHEKDTRLYQKEVTTSMRNGSADDDTGTPNQASSKVDDLLDGKMFFVNSDVTDHQPDTVRGPGSSGEILKQAGESVENTVGSLVSHPGVRDGTGNELSRSKSTASRVKKKRKEILQKADAAGTTSDLYMAYKGPEEKKENIVSSEAPESTSSNSVEKQAPSDKAQADGSSVTKGTSNKTEPEDWEDVVDVSTPKLETSDGGVRNGTRLMPQNEDDNAHSAKKYSRDFLLKFSERCCELPNGFEITSDISDVLMSNSVPNLVDHDPHPTPGRVVDRTNSSSRMDRRTSGMGDDDKWSKLSGHFGMGRDLRVDVGFAGNAGFRSGQGGNFGVLKNARTQASPQFHTGILAGPMQSMVPQGGVPRNSPDADRWQRATNFQQTGLIPSPQTPLQVMHKAERKYEIGKTSDEEEAKQRQLKAILNKLTPQNFEKLFEQVKDVNIDNARTLAGVISQIFDKALMEPTFCEMYAYFCYHLAGELPDFVEDNEKITFKRLLLNKCQEEFERGEKEQEEANRADAEGEIKQSPEEREEKRLNARRRMLGNIRLIGELYKKRMLTERIMHECIIKLLGQYQNPDEEDLESLCKLMSTIGEMIDHPKAKDHMDAYFDRMAMLSNNMKLSSRIRFMLKDSIDLRRNKWQQRRKVEGPKKIDDVHRDAAQERHSQASRLARSPSMNQSGRRTPMDFGPRGSAMVSPSTPMGGFRGLPNQARGFGNQDARFVERQPYEPRAVPLTQRPLGDDSITLGPQGGLARGMSGRGPSANASNPILDPVESRRMMAAFNGFSNVSERSVHNSREDLLTRYGTTERVVIPSAYDQANAQERNMNFVNKDPRNDRSFGRPFATSPPSRVQAPASTQSLTSEKELLEEVLRDKSLAAIKEYYSARDEREVALCIKELDSPSFHPSMVSFWVNDSFERKDMERDLLAKLLVNLTRSEESILTQLQLVKGFESVLTSLEDIVNDAPKAAEFLGRIFGKAVSEKVVPLEEIGQLLLAGGEEPERLKEMGLAGDVIGSILETVKVEKGESLMNETKASSNLHLADFLPKDGYRSRILEKFI